MSSVVINAKGQITLSEDIVRHLGIRRGDKLGADAFVSFDKRAVKLLEAQGKSARLLT